MQNIKDPREREHRK